MLKQKKPIGALCIAPVIIAKLLTQVLVTVGQSPTVSSDIQAMNARHATTTQGEITVDKQHKIVTTPCYMLDSRVDMIGEGIDCLVKQVLKLTLN